MTKSRVLFVCIHNSARSQMAEAFVRHLCGATVEAESAGIEPGEMNPVVVEVMAEIGIDLSRATTKSVADVIASGRAFDTVVTVCDETNAERCPVVPGAGRRLHWGLPDPSALRGTPDERRAGTRTVRDAIRARVEAWCRDACRV